MDVLVRFLNGFLMLVLPLGLGFLLARRMGLPWRLYVIGGLTFVGSQVLHLPFNSLVLAPLTERLGWTIEPGGFGLVGIAVAFGLSAGVFEELARYLVLRTRLRTDRNWSQALMFGAGHGGIEAILLGGLTLFGLFQALALRDADLATVVPPEQLELARAQLEAYWATPWPGALLGALERAFALCLHLSLTVLVLQVFRRRQIAWLALAVAWHAAVNAVAVFAVQTWGPYVAEALVAVAALISLGILFGLRTPDDPEPEPAPLQPPPELVPRPLEPTPERLDDSRYAAG